MTRRLSLIITVLILSATFAIGVAWNIISPPTIDDYSYKTICTSNEVFWSDLGDNIETFGDAWQSIVGHMKYVNGRLSNLIIIAVQPLPPLAVDIFAGIMVGLFGLLLSAWASGGLRRVTTIGAIVGTAAAWIVFPWHDFMQATDFQANYVWPSVMTLLTLFTARKWRNYGRVQHILTIALALATGWMHEAFGATLCAYSFIKALTTTSRTRRCWWYVCAAVFSGFCIGVGCGTLLRLNHFTQSEKVIFSSNIAIRIAVDIWPAYIALVILAIDKLRQHCPWRDILRSHLPCIMAVTVGTIMVLILGYVGRGCWPAELYSILLLLDVAAPLLRRKNSAYTSTAGCIFLALYTVWGTQLCKYESIMARQHENLVSFLARENHNLYPADDIILNDDLPWYMMYIPFNPLQNGGCNMTAVTYHSRKPYSMVLPVPDSLIHMPFSSWPRVPGNNDFRGIWPYIATTDTATNTHPIITYGRLSDNASPADRLYDLALGHPDSLRRYQELSLNPISMPDGSTIFWITPIINYRSAQHRPILRIDTVPE